jgi:hypothetical protein
MAPRSIVLLLLIFCFGLDNAEVGRGEESTTRSPTAMLVWSRLEMHSSSTRDRTSVITTGVMVAVCACFVVLLLVHIVVIIKRWNKKFRDRNGIHRENAPPFPGCCRRRLKSDHICSKQITRCFQVFRSTCSGWAENIQDFAFHFAALIIEDKSKGT